MIMLKRDERLERINRLDPYGGVGIISIARARASRKSFALFPPVGFYSGNFPFNVVRKNRLKFYTRYRAYFNTITTFSKCLNI